MRLKTAGLIIGVALLLGGCKDISSVLKKYNYLAQVPPVALHGPGDIVYKRGASAGSLFRSSNSVSLGYICDPRYVTKESEPLVSPTESTTIANEIGGNLSFTGPEIANGLGITAAASAIRKVELKVENVQVLEYPLDTLETIVSSLGPKCRDILRRQKKKGNAWQVVSAVKADVSYAVTYNADVSAEVKAKLQSEIGAKLGFKTSGSESEAGKGLYYGLELSKL